jgi:hypothetical protein
MFTIIFSDIKWREKRGPTTLTYTMDPRTEGAWDDIYQDSYRGKHREFRSLLTDTFWVQAEREWRDIIANATVKFRSDKV